MEEYARRCAEWLQSQVTRAEEQDPALRPLKDRISSFGKAIDAENSRPEPDEKLVSSLLRQQEEAIFALIQHVAQPASGKSAA